MIDVHFDFETYSDFDLINGGTWGYSEHPSTEVICMAYAYGDETPQLWLPGQVLPDFLYQRGVSSTKDHNYRLHAHNAFFEYCIILNVLKIAPPPLDRWVDTAAYAAALSLPRALAQLGPVLGVQPKDEKDPYGGYLIKKLCVPQKYTKAELIEKALPDTARWRNRDLELLDRMYKYCIKDVMAERACEAVMIPLSPNEQKIWEVDQVINLRGVNVDVPLVKDCIAIYEKQVVILTRKLKAITDLDNPNSQVQFLKWAKQRGYTEEDLQADTLRDFLESPRLLSKSLYEAILLKVSLSRTAPKKFYALLRRLGLDGRNRGNFMYHGANTGRWASVGINLQNLLRPKMGDVDLILSMLPDRDIEALEMYWGDVVEALASCVRGMLIPTPGNRFIICDYAQVEARIIAWLAGEEDTLTIFKEGKDIYVHAASQIFQMDASAVGPDERFAGKTAVLACGFQGGWSALQRMAKGYGVELGDGFCNEIVMKWRKANPRIVTYWTALEQAAISAIKNPGTEYPVGLWMLDEEKPLNLPSVIYKFARGYLFCQLPSGRVLAYASPSLEKKTVRYFKIQEGEYSRSVVYSADIQSAPQFEATADEHGAVIKEFDTYSIRYFGVHPKTKRWSRLHLYGGLLSENVTQAVARDLLAHAMIKAEEQDYKIVLHVHDELVADMPQGEGSFEGLRSIMLDSSRWAEGLPLDATGGESERFKK